MRIRCVRRIFWGDELKNEIEELVDNMSQSQKKYHLYHQPDSNVSKLIRQRENLKCKRCHRRLRNIGKLFYCECGAVWAQFFAPNEIWEMLSWNPLESIENKVSRNAY